MTDDNEDEVQRLEQDIRHTQDQIGDTVSKLKVRLSPRRRIQSLFSTRHGQASRWIGTAKALAMIGASAIWLIRRSKR